jgi:PIN domain nuclease of toxin-antitoxin system
MLFDKHKSDNVNRNVVSVLDDYENLFYVSSVALSELVRLYNDDKLKSFKFKSYNDVLSFIDDLGIEIKPFTRQHVVAYAELTPAPNHKDPADHMIIAQAIADKIPIISSDGKFKLYQEQGLRLVFNKR